MTNKYKPDDTHIALNLAGTLEKSELSNIYRRDLLGSL